MDPPDGPLAPLPGAETLFRVFATKTRFRPCRPQGTKASALTRLRCARLIRRAVRWLAFQAQRSIHHDDA